MAEAIVNGYKIREAIRQLEVKKSALRNQFNGSFFKFDDENKDSPELISNQFDSIESQIARLQEAQTRYNLEVQVDFKGREIALLLAIKLVGGKGRVEGMWRKATSPKARRRYYEDDISGPRERQKDVTVSKSVYTESECTAFAIDAMNTAGQLRAAIANGNTTEVTLDLDVDLIELV